MTNLRDASLAGERRGLIDTMPGVRWRDRFRTPASPTSGCPGCGGGSVRQSLTYGAGAHIYVARWRGLTRFVGWEVELCELSMAWLGQFR